MTNRVKLVYKFKNIYTKKINKKKKKKNCVKLDANETF